MGKMKIAKYIALVVVMMASIVAGAQKRIAFDEAFVDTTLRVDYVFAGDAREQRVYLDCLSSQPHWAGRRVNMERAPYRGNGCVRMKRKSDGEVMYEHTYSSLFQEYIVTEEAQKVARSFENSFQLPMPREIVEVECILYDNYGREIASIKHEVDPKDILIRQRRAQEGDGRQVVVIKESGTYREKIDIAIVSEGYAKDESGKFMDDAKRAAEALMEHEPFKSMSDRFNIRAVFVPSAESGVSIPKKGEWHDSALGSHYSTFYSDRYLTTLNVKTVHDNLTGVEYEHILILANTKEYGGGGIYNSYTMASAGHKTMKPVVVHEMGHSFGGLADEYYYEEELDTLTYPTAVEPWEPNITTKVEFEKKWEWMIGDERWEKMGVGVYEGGGYTSKGVYRPAHNCRMRTNENPDFCPVCQEALKRLIRYYTEEVSW